MGCHTFFECKDKLGILELISGSKEELAKCLGSNFTELDPSKSEGAGEKHLPCVTVNSSLVTVSVGSVAHPMSEEHSIGWIYLETTEGSQLKKLTPDSEPKAVFALAPNEKPVSE
ncbi:MAG: desulfoferrodoxin [Lachnospiraceae bacterium]|nr:desulfoferrodoxin [Lachnospiraceae bacterium]